MDPHRATTTADRVRDFQRRYIKLRESFERDRLGHYQALNEYLAVLRGRYLRQSDDRGFEHSKARFNKRMTTEAAIALRTLESGMLAGATSEVRPWFALTIGPGADNDDPRIRRWLDAVRDVLLLICSESNFYGCARMVYYDLGSYGTATMITYPDFDNVIWNYVASPGEAYLALSERRVVDQCYRRDTMNVSQLVREFGLDNVSRQTKQLWETKSYHTEIPVLQVIEPRLFHSDHQPMNNRYPWRNVYIEMASQKRTNADVHMLEESGFRERPLMTPRWESNMAEPYGTSPGMLALPEVQSLHVMKYRRAQAVDFMAQPVLGVPSEMKTDFSRLPGATNYYNAQNPGRAGSLWDPTLSIRELRDELNECVGLIQRAFFSDLFQMMMLSDRREITATEVVERHEEKMLMLGPVLDNVHGEFLDPFIDRAYAIAVRAGIMPPPPDDVEEGAELRVQYTSILAQAQRLVGLGPIERLLGIVAPFAGVKPGTVNKIDEYELVDEVGTILGVPADIIIETRKARATTDQQTQAAALQQQAATMPDAAAAARTLSETRPSNSDLLGQLLGQR